MTASALHQLYRSKGFPNQLSATLHPWKRGLLWFKKSFYSNRIACLDILCHALNKTLERYYVRISFLPLTCPPYFCILWCYFLFLLFGHTTISFRIILGTRVTTSNQYLFYTYFYGYDYMNTIYDKKRELYFPTSRILAYNLLCLWHKNRTEFTFFLLFILLQPIPSAN